MIILFLTIGLASVSNAFERPIPFQGRLKAVDGQHINNPSASFTAGIYAQDVGGDPLWTEQFSNIPITGGLFSSTLTSP